MTITRLNPEAPDRSSAPSWIREALEGYDSEEKRHAYREIAKRLPGVMSVFEYLIHSLDDVGVSHEERPGEFPVAAGIVRKTEAGGLEIVSLANNKTNALNDSTAHAEMVAIKEAEEKLGDKHLSGLYLLSTCEPCVMCGGAAVNTELDGVIYGVSHADVSGTHALVDGEYKPWRTTPESIDTATYLSDSGLEVISGYMADEVQGALKRVHGSWSGYYRDPDA